MPKRLTTQQFIERARSVHGDVYDYSQARYVRSNEKVVIVCPHHGPFSQTPNSHLSGAGCPTCARARSHTPAANAKRAVNIRACLRKRYGVDNILDVPGARTRQRETMLERYGVDNPAKNREIRDRISLTNLQRYGGPSPMASESVRAKNALTRQQKQSVRTCLATEDPMKVLYARLVETFGEGDVERGYRDEERYPYACDFHIASRDLFIEVNAGVTHGGQWFDQDSVACRAQLVRWHEDAVRRAYVDTWCRRDVEKRACAREHGLNYVMFWNSRLHDADVWFALGCPDGRDWERRYSWVPERELSPWPARRLAVGSTTVTDIARSYQFDIIYARELALWREDAPYKDTNMPLSVALLWNRMRYANRMPLEITDHQILSGFKIAGVVPSYSRFDNTLMQMAIERHGITSVYDPCAGWGERMLTCAALGLPYVGVDVNERLRDGYARMERDYGLTDQRVVIADAATVGLTGVAADAVVTCPPYGDTELYSEHGAERYGEHQFAAWWGRVVEHTACALYPRLICVQTNQRYRDVFLRGLTDAGYTLTDELVSEGMRRRIAAYHRGGRAQRREFESMLVASRS